MAASSVSPLVDACLLLRAGFQQCGLFVEVFAVDCVLSLGGVALSGAGTGQCHVPQCQCLPVLGCLPRRHLTRCRASPVQFFLTDCNWLSVGMGFLLDLIGRRGMGMTSSKDEKLPPITYDKDSKQLGRLLICSR